MERHRILGGKVSLYRRAEGGKWHCYTCLDGKEWRRSTKERSLALAKDVAEDWYLELCAKKRFGELQSGKTFAQVALQFEKEYEAITQGRRSPKWVQGHKDRIRLHLLPYFGKMSVQSITSGAAQEYRVQRMTKPADWNDDERVWRPPARNTLHNEIVTLSMVLKTAYRHGWIEHVPDLSDPYRRQTKVEHRPWFTPNEYKLLYQSTRANAAEPTRPHFKWHAEQLHDFVLFAANTGLRPDELKQLEFRDVEIVDDDYSGEHILEIEVRGKRGVGYCKSMPGAVRPFERLRDRKRLSGEDDAEERETLPTDRLFPNEFKKMFNRILADNNLKFDRNGKARTAYSLRHSYICFRLLEGADIYQVAKNCRTSVEMIEKHYAAHLKDMIDTSLVNVRRPKPSKNSKAQTQTADPSGRGGDRPKL
ncbi:site-specific integrase [Porphyrobacter algicida]|uniref:Site-specific integrase n=1 Tax=Qipengyuania algicida TaxID=1836209 RepID=A0A845AJA8_9SPHN|nr:site-specific integrase [Qipengyuania algicida]MXP29694.1 site-specific integrase [Qipengyuania algicida]